MSECCESVSFQYALKFLVIPKINARKSREFPFCPISTMIIHRLMRDVPFSTSRVKDQQKANKKSTRRSLKMSKGALMLLHVGFESHTFELIKLCMLKATVGRKKTKSLSVCLKLKNFFSLVCVKDDYWVVWSYRLHCV